MLISCVIQTVLCNPDSCSIFLQSGRSWKDSCACGCSLDRDHNAAKNILKRAGHAFKPPAGKPPSVGGWLPGTPPQQVALLGARGCFGVASVPQEAAAIYSVRSVTERCA